jgi:hypothetical protein
MSFSWSSLARLGMVVEETRGRFVQIRTERQPPGQYVLVEHLERIANGTPAKIELAPQLAGGPGRLLRGRCPRQGERAAACTRSRYDATG